jgi:hypothetical protein
LCWNDLHRTDQTDGNSPSNNQENAR